MQDRNEHGGLGIFGEAQILAVGTMPMTWTRVPSASRKRAGQARAFEVVGAVGDVGVQLFVDFLVMAGRVEPRLKTAV